MEHLLIRLQNFSIRYKLLFLLIFNVIIISACSFAGYYICINAYNNILYDSISANLSFSSYTMSDKLDQIEALSSMIISSDQIQQGLTDIYYASDDRISLVTSDAKNNINSLLLNYCREYQSAGVSYIALYNKYSSLSTNIYHFRSTPQEQLNAALEAAQAADGRIAWSTTKADNGCLMLSRQIKRIANLDLTPIGSVIIFTDLNTIADACSKGISQYENLQYIITDDSENVLCHSASLTDESASFLSAHSQKPYKTISDNGNVYFCVSAIVPKYGYKYISLIPFDIIYSKLRMIILSSIALVTIGIAVVIILTNIIIYRMLRQFKELIERMKHFSYDVNLNPPPAAALYTKDEIGQLHMQFDQMSQKIHDLVETNYVNELLTKNAQLSALKSQINPHFLYNTLESINWRAVASGEDQISQMVEALGTLLRSALSYNESLVTIEHELSLVRSFLTIEKIRYEERLEYAIYVQENLSDAIIPPLTIQPLLENAIRYGLEEMIETCHIYVNITSDNNLICVSVKNEGSVFEENLLEQLKSNQRKPNGFGIGLLNIDQRIKLLFGKCYGLSLINEDDCACANLLFPYKTKGDDINV